MAFFSYVLANENCPDDQAKQDNRDRPIDDVQSFHYCTAISLRPASPSK